MPNHTEHFPGPLHQPPLVSNLDRTVTNVNNTVDAIREPLKKDLAELERTLQEARRRRPPLRVLQHVGYGVSIRAAARYACAVGFHDPRVTARGVARARRLGLDTTVYTVNDAARARTLLDLGVTALFSDAPDRIRPILSSAATGRPGDPAP